MSHAAEQLASIWRDLEEYICCTLLGVIMTLLMMQVCYRYFGGKSIAWSEEVSRFLFLYLVYFAASLAASKNLHIRVTAQLKLLPKLGQMLLLLTTDIIWLIFCIIVVNVGTDFIISMSDRPMVSGALMLDMRYALRGDGHRLYLARPSASSSVGGVSLPNVIP